MKKAWILVTAVFLALSLTAFSGCNGGGSNNKPDDKIDIEKFPFYEEDYALLSYDFGEEQMVRPFFLGNTIYNETVMPVDSGVEISGMLQFEPLKILSVRDFAWEREFVEGVDYTVSGRKLVLSPGSAIPYLTEENLRGVNVPQPYRKVDSISNVETDFMMMGANVIYTEGTLVYGHQISVSYVYDVKDLSPDVYPRYMGDKLPKLSAKLKSGQPVNLAITGDSVGEGCSSSKYFNRAPYMDNFITLAKDGLEREYGSDITLVNLSKGGEKSAWGQAGQQINKVVAAAPDVLFIHFGINDCGDRISANMFRDNIELLILQVRDELPDCEFVIINAFPPNFRTYDQSLMEQYWLKTAAIEKQHSGVAVLDMYSQGVELLKNKKYMDVTGNGINHLNDYSARLYAMSILSSLIEY